MALNNCQIFSSNDIVPGQENKARILTLDGILISDKTDLLSKVPKLHDI